MRNYLLKFLFLIVSISIQDLKAQIEVSLLSIPSVTNIYTPVAAQNFNSIGAFNFGFNIASKKGNNINFNYGIIHSLQGAKHTVSGSNPTDPLSQAISSYSVYFRTKSLIAPFALNYTFFQPKENINISVILGIGLGYIYSQVEENTAIPEDYTSNTVSPTPIQRFTNNAVFNKFYSGLNSGVEIKKYYPSFFISAKPTFMYHLYSKIPGQEYYESKSNKLLSYSIEIGIGKSFGSKSGKN